MPLYESTKLIIDSTGAICPTYHLGEMAKAAEVKTLSYVNGQDQI